MIEIALRAGGGFSGGPLFIFIQLFPIIFFLLITLLLTLLTVHHGFGTK